MSEKVVPIRKTFVEDYGDFQEKHIETRYIVVDEETGEVLDDAQGFHKTPRQAVEIEG